MFCTAETKAHSLVIHKDGQSVLNKQTLGYRTLAVDQLSGGDFNGVHNETVARIGRNTGYEAAYWAVVEALSARYFLAG